MPAFKWQRRPTKHFGEVAVPIADVELQGIDGRFRAFSLQVDSGAVVSLLRRSVGELLGINVAEGREITLSSVGGASTGAFVHSLAARFSETMVGPVEFAIADNETVPNLLGRRGVFDQLQVDFDSTLEATTVLNRWLDPGQLRLWDVLNATSERMATAWAANPLPEPGDEAVGQLVRRGEQLVATAAGLMKLHRTFEGPLLVRALFEASLQVEHILQSPAERGRLFLDFAKVSRFQYTRRIAENPYGPMGRRIASSPLRAAGELRNKAEYESVAARFERRNKTLWDKWYCMSLAELAERLEKRGEYDLWYKFASGWAHGDPFATERAKPYAGSGIPTLFQVCLHFFGRMLYHAADAKKILLEAEHFELLKACLQRLD